MMTAIQAAPSYVPSPIKRQRRTTVVITDIRAGMLVIVAAHQPITVMLIFYLATVRGLVAMVEAEILQTYGQRPDFGELFRPGPALPDAVILVAHGRPLAEGFGVAQQVLRKRVERRHRRRPASATFRAASLQRAASQPPRSDPG